MQWIKIYTGITTDPKFRLIARDAGVSTAEALGVWLMILEKAGEADGDATGFNPRLGDITYDMPDGKTEAIINVMQGIGMLDGMVVAKWEERQAARKKSNGGKGFSSPKSNAERQRDYRERQKLLKDADSNNDTVTESNVTRNVTPCNVTGSNVTHNVTGNGSNVTRNESNALKDKNRIDKIKNIKLNTASAPQSGQAAPPEGVAELSLVPLPENDSAKTGKRGKKGTPPNEPHYQAKSGRYLTGKRLDSFMLFWNVFAFTKGKAEAADAWLDIPQLTDVIVARICDAARQEAVAREAILARGGTPKWAQAGLMAGAGKTTRRPNRRHSRK